MWHGKTVSVVLMTYAEKGSIRAVIRGFEATGVVDEILVVNNNAEEGTSQEVARTSAREVFETAQGYGNASRRGLREATGDLIVLAEPDGTFLPDDIHKLLVFSGECDVVFGTRTTREMIWKEANMGWFLRHGNWWVAKMLMMLFDTPSISDCGCTMRLIHREPLERFVSKLTVGASHFLPEMMILAVMHNVKMIELPVNYRGRVGESKITGNLKGVFRTGFRMIQLIWRYRFQYWFGKT